MNERGAGRPRDHRLDDSIASAAREVMFERGYHAATYAEIARRAGVGTPAVYRRWPAKWAIGIDLVEREFQTDPIPDTGSIRSDLGSFMRLRIQNLGTPLFHHVMLPLAEEAYAHPEIAERVRARFFAYREPQLEPRIRKAMAEGELRPDTDPGRLVDMLVGSLNMTVLFARDLPSEQDAAAIVDMALDGFGGKDGRHGG